jgi:hypothetical protein
VDHETIESGGRKLEQEPRLVDRDRHDDRRRVLEQVLRNSFASGLEDLEDDVL